MELFNKEIGEKQRNLHGYNRDHNDMNRVHDRSHRSDDNNSTIVAISYEGNISQWKDTKNIYTINNHKNVESFLYKSMDIKNH